MNLRRVIGVITLVIGSGTFVLSDYIAERVTEGKEKIASAERKIEQGQGLFSLNPVTKEIGKGIAGSAQKKIDEAHEKVSYYEEVAGWMHIGGLSFAVLGLLLIFFPKRK